MTHSAKTRHYTLWCLAARTTAFCALLFYALAAPDQFLTDLHWPLRCSPLTVVWGLLMVSMVMRLFPSRVESLGCQKVFARRHHPTGKAPEVSSIHRANRGAALVALVWVCGNALVFFCYAQGWLGLRFLVCLAGFYGVCDIVCILFFCPFQTFWMHNRCCTTCRIYDWDYLMLCTPLLAVGGPLAISACALAAVLFVRWEVVHARHPERFYEESNQALRCSACQEQLCRYKRRLAAAAGGKHSQTTPQAAAAAGQCPPSHTESGQKTPHRQ